MIKVIIVDDHPVVREGLKRVITENTGMAVTAEAGDGHEALNVIRNQPCDVVLLDLLIPERHGFDVLKTLHAEKPKLPVLVLSSFSEDEYAVRCLRAGAAGYLKKETAVAEVIPAIRKVLRGRNYVSESLAHKLLSARNPAAEAPHKALSNREYQVLCMLASGKTVSQIAIELSVSIKTVSTYRVRILEKLMLKTTAELIRYAIKEGLVN
jgi:two-component system invasion response regulator UvrY